ncbi:glycosyltransferase family 61 protein [Salisaeta longa]|uniref:glycosyltransferase family 61 protein n=1 Tax=Salisaeta longa TaxID=503170 RepID=UPI0003B67796|nr:glycosyltransferase family 61 protein [Salisaeta longa]
MPDVRDILKEKLPPALVQPLRAAYFRLFRHPAPQTVPFDALFPAVQKHEYVPPRSVPVPVMPHPFVRQAQSLATSAYTMPEDYVAVLDDVEFCPTNNVVLRSDKRILYESLNTGQLPNIDLRALYVRSTDRIAGYATPLHSLYNNYYHDIVDGLPRLLALHGPPFDALPHIAVLHSAPLSDHQRFFVERVLPPNATLRHVPEGRRYVVEHLLFTPFKTRRFAGYMPPPYVRELRTRFGPDGPVERGRRLFISRERAGKRFITNREALLREVLEPLGFESVTLETMAPAEQLACMHQAEAVVGAHGAGLANVLFAPAGTRVIELFPAHFMVPHYFFLCQSLGHPYAAWCGTATARDPGGFAVDLAAVHERLHVLLSSPATAAAL